MLFSSASFLFVFLPVVLLVYYGFLRGHRGQQNIFLLLASLVFYAWGEPWFVLVMMASIAVNYLLGLWVHAYRQRSRYLHGPITAAAVCNLGLLFVFKYLTFTLDTLHGLLGGFVVPIIELPIGISFFTFQAMSYVFDVALGKAEVQRSPLKLGLYIALFPQLIAGPIVKYSTVAGQIDARRETWEDFSAGCARFIVGLGKKVLLSNQLAIIADGAWKGVGAEPEVVLTSGLAWLGSLAYTLQIYYDFSGYSDMAIGLGKMFGFHFLENFDHPYAAATFTGFWRRWHISLSSWFRDYVYIPLGGSRGSRRATVRNLFVVWLLTGVWHGANWTFLLWGLLHFILLYLEKFRGVGSTWPQWCRRGYTLLMVNFAWVLFRAPDLPAAGQFLAAMLWSSPDAFAAGLEVYYLGQYLPWLILAVIMAFPVMPWLSRQVTAYFQKYAPDVFPLWDGAYAAALACIFLSCAAFLVKGTHNPFIYFNF